MELGGPPRPADSPRTQAAWTVSNEHMLTLLEAHFEDHDYVLGGRLFNAA